MNAMTDRCHHHLLMCACVFVGLTLAGGCASGPSSDTLSSSDAQMTRLAQQAKTVFEMQRPAQAASLYQAALDRARALNDDASIARLAYNLGACRLDSGDAPGACAALQESVYAARVAGLPEEEACLLLGYAFLQQDATDLALALATKTLQTMGGRDGSDMRLRLQLLRAEAYLQGDRMESGQETLQDVLQQLTPNSASGIQAQAAHVEGVILSRQETPLQASEAFIREAAFWQAATRPSDIADALVLAALELRKAQAARQEADCRYRASRALVGLGRLDEAAVQLDRLEDLPKSEWPDALTSLVPLLQQEIEQREGGG